ncbi:MAG TPA: hypothetical protein VIJ39_11950 [Solirubrobacteraceae bacterium]
MIARRLMLTTVVSLWSLIGFLSFSAPAALAVTPPVVEEESVLDVAGTSATLQATVDPEGTETTYRFEYGTSEAYGSQIPVPDGLVGAGSAGVTVSAHPQELTPSTTYHYRVVALVAGRSETIPGSDGTFVTQPAGSEFALPDGRQWEMVSPPNKNGALIEPIGEGVIQAAEDGNAITYLTRGVLGSNPEANVLEGAQVFSTRDADGWSSQDISTPHDMPNGATSGLGAEYRFFSSDLSLGVIEQLGEDRAPLAPEVSEPTLYLHENGTARYEPLATASNISSGAKLANSDGSSDLKFLSATPDFSHVVVESPERLTPNASTYEDGLNLYEWSGGQLRLISVLPNGESAVGGEGNNIRSAFLGAGRENVRNAISDNGSRIVWGTEAPQDSHLYLRDTNREETIQLDAAQGAPEPKDTHSRGSQFQIASNGGSRVFFTDDQRLTADSTASEGAPDLYECEVEEVVDKLACKLVDLTVDQNAGESAAVERLVLGTSEDGSHVYFVARGALTSAENSEHEKAAPGADNLYMLHDNGTEWITTFIAVLSSEDAPDWGGELGLVGLTSRVSPNGRYLAFMSERRLTGYDNRDANSGVPDEEVYLYDASSNRLVCASCDPTGERPVGLSYSNQRPLVDGRGVWDGRWLAASIPGWTPLDLTVSLYQSRYLSDSGRLFFDSVDALVPQDIDGVEDVYEYEPTGVGSCEGSSVTFNEQTDGCVGLISSGTSDEESAFMDASENGNDVFFLTSSQLVPQDFDTSYDIYDAQVCSASEPCLLSAVSPPPCDTGDSCKAALSPQPSIFGAPSSSTFAGAGNIVASPSKTVVRPKSLTRAQKLARVLRACRKKPKKKRARCERRARKQYKVKQSREANQTKKGKR